MSAWTHFLKPSKKDSVFPGGKTWGGTGVLSRSSETGSLIITRAAVSNSQVPAWPRTAPLLSARGLASYFTETSQQPDAGPPPPSILPQPQPQHHHIALLSRGQALSSALRAAAPALLMETQAQHQSDHLPPKPAAPLGFPWSAENTPILAHSSFSCLSLIFSRYSNPVCSVSTSFASPFSFPFVSLD